jgi:DNA-binding NarL/FixJ family response regulator
MTNSGREIDRPLAQMTAARCRALLLATQGQLVEALAALERGLAEQPRLPIPLEVARTLLAKGQLQRRCKQKCAARQSLERAAAAFEEIGASLWAVRARAELARIGLRGNIDELTATEERVAALAVSGLTNREIAARAFISQKTVEANLSRIYRKLDICSRAELGLRLAQLPHP